MLLDLSHQICSPQFWEEGGRKVGNWHAEDGWSQHLKYREVGLRRREPRICS
jgi:hypothetical protein